MINEMKHLFTSQAIGESY